LLHRLLILNLIFKLFALAFYFSSLSASKKFRSCFKSRIISSSQTKFWQRGILKYLIFGYEGTVLSFLLFLFILFIFSLFLMSHILFIFFIYLFIFTFYSLFSFLLLLSKFFIFCPHGSLWLVQVCLVIILYQRLIRGILFFCPR